MIDLKEEKEKEKDKNASESSFGDKKGTSIIYTNPIDRLNGSTHWQNLKSIIFSSIEREDW